MFSQTAEYALRVIMYLGKQEGAPATTRQIAAATRVPEGYLSKVIQNLSRTGLINSQRGLHGGSTLARDPASLTVYDVIQAVDPFPRIESCPLKIKSHGANLCALHRRLDDAMAMVEKALKDSTIADLLKENRGSTPLCEVPGAASEEREVELTVGRKSARRTAR